MSDSAAATEKKKGLPSFARSLFQGSIEESLIFPFPHLPEEERESLDMVLESFERFGADKLDAARFDAQMEIPQDIIRQLAELGVLGITVPEEYGGFGFSTGAYARLMESVCRRCASTATVVGGHQSIGIKGILLFGNEEQKREFLPGMASGEWIGAYALTEPGSGSDAAAMSTRAVYDEKDDVWVINGRKQWITNGGFARVFTVFARTDTPGETRPTKTVSCFLVMSDLEGVSTTPPMHKMGIRGSNTVDVVLDNVRVPARHLLGGVGSGFKIAMEILNTGRLSLASGCIGACKDMIEGSADHALERKAFGTTISEFEMVRAKFAEMMAETYAAEAMVYLTTGLCDRGGTDFSLESAMCKIFASETLWRVVNHAVQINGGNGYMSEYRFERVLRDSRINLIFEGTNEILRHYVAMAGLKDLQPASGAALPRLEKAAAELTDEAAEAASLTRDLAAAAGAALKRHGAALIQREHVQKRIADASIDLYAVLACLSRTTSRIADGGADAAADALKLTRLFCRQAWPRIRKNLDEIETNDDDLVNEVADIAYASRGYRLH